VVKIEVPRDEIFTFNILIIVYIRYYNKTNDNLILTCNKPVVPPLVAAPLNNPPKSPPYNNNNNNNNYNNYNNYYNKKKIRKLKKIRK
jgi:hypothetical protein